MSLGNAKPVCFFCTKDFVEVRYYYNGIDDCTLIVIPVNMAFLHMIETNCKAWSFKNNLAKLNRKQIKVYILLQIIILAKYFSWSSFA